jgi:hypothetical protein
MINLIESLNLNGAEKVLFNYEKKFWIELLKFSDAEAEEKAYHKIINIRDMSKKLSNPKSKAYFPY